MIAPEDRAAEPALRPAPAAPVPADVDVPASDGPPAPSALWTSRLLAVTQMLNAAQGPTAALGDALRAVASALEATSAVVAVLDGDRLTFRPDLFTTRPIDPGAPLDFSLDDPMATTAAVRLGEPVWIPSLAVLRDRFPRAFEAVKDQHEEVAWAAVPIRTGGDVIGVLRLAWPAPQTFPPEQRAFLQATADHAGHVLHRVRLLERERALREDSEAATARTARLLALARGLAAARTSHEVGEVLAATGYGGTGAVAGGIGLLDEPAGRLRILSVIGGASWGELPLSSSLPFVRAAVTGEGHASTREEVGRLDPRALAWMEGAGSHLALAVPLHDDTRVVGSLSVHLPEASIDEASMQHVHAVAALVGQALGRAWAQEQAQGAVEELQRALLPRELPSIEGLGVHAGYRASVRAGEIGGDFYDVVARDDGGAVLLLGDVQGHDLTASAIMAQLRALLHTLALEGEPPAELLTRADRFLAAIEPDRLATAVAVDVTPGSGLVAISVAGHLPPIVSTSSGARLLEVEPGLPLGMLDAHRTEHVVALPEATRLVLLTDGLVERRDEAITSSLARLAAALPPGTAADPQALVARLLEEAPRHTGDDAAVLVADLAAAATLPSALSRTLPPGLRTATTARHWARVGLQRLGVGQDALDEVLVVLTELVSNAARVAGSGVTVTLADAAGALRVGVRDDSERRPWTRTAADDDTEGRGLAIVAALSKRWWVEDHETGKTVWAEFGPA